MRWLGQIAIGVMFALCFWMGAETVIGSAVRQRADLVSARAWAI